MTYDPKSTTTIAAILTAAALAFLAPPGFADFIGLLKIVIPAYLAADLGHGVAAKVADYKLAKAREGKMSVPPRTTEAALRKEGEAP